VPRPSVHSQVQDAVLAANGSRVLTPLEIIPKDSIVAAAAPSSQQQQQGQQQGQGQGQGQQGRGGGNGSQAAPASSGSQQQQQQQQAGAYAYDLQQQQVRGAKGRVFYAPFWGAFPKNLTRCVTWLNQSCAPVCGRPSPREMLKSGYPLRCSNSRGSAAPSSLLGRRPRQRGGQ